MQLNKDQVNTILKNAPTGADKKKILDGLILRGYDLEGVDSNAVRQNLNQENQEPTKEDNILQETGKDIAQIGSDIKKSAIERADNLGEKSTLFQKLGQGAGLASDVIGNVFKGVVKAILPQKAETGVKKGMEKVITPIMESDIAKNVIQKYNSLDEETKKNIDASLGIVSLATDVAGLGIGGKAVKTGVKTGLKTAEEIGSTALKTGEKIIEPIAKTASGVADYGISRAPKAMAIFSGETDDVIKYALKDPKVADLGLEQGDVALRNAVNGAAKESVELKNNFTKAYSVAKDEILGQYTKTLVPKKDIKVLFDDLLKENDVKVLADGTLDFTRSKIIANPGEVGKIKQAYETLNSYKSFNLSSLDDYKQLIGKLARFPQEGGGSSKSPVLGRFYYQLNEVATTKLPKDLARAYSEANDTFSKNIELFDDMVDAFNSGDPFSRMAGIFSQQKDTMRQIVEFYEKQSGKNIMSIVAGREIGLGKKTSTGAWSLISPRSWIDLLISPQKQGKIILKLGEKLPKQK